MINTNILIAVGSAPSVHAELERMAYYNWEDAGRPEGQCLRFWLSAEREMFDIPDYDPSEDWTDSDIDYLAMGCRFA